MAVAVSMAGAATAAVGIANWILNAPGISPANVQKKSSSNNRAALNRAALSFSQTLQPARQSRKPGHSEGIRQACPKNLNFNFLSRITIGRTLLGLPLRRHPHSNPLNKNPSTLLCARRLARLGPGVIFKFFPQLRVFNTIL
jgi:hypothetical protein